MKSTLCLAFSLSTFISTSLSLPSHAYIRNGHALAMKHSRAIKDIVTPLVKRSEVEDLTELEKRSIRRFGTLDFGHQLQSRSNEDEEDDSEDDSEDGEDDEDCDDETDDENNTDTSSTSNDTTQNTTVPTYTAPKPKKVPSWTATEPTKKKTTPTYTAPEKKEHKVDVSAGVSVSTSYSGGISIGASTYHGKATFFSQGGVAGACGTVHQDSDYVVAIDSSMYEGGKFCGKTIAVTRISTGKTIHCVGADECPGCPDIQSLDLSIAAFNALGNPDEGVFDIKWEVVS